MTEATNVHHFPINRTKGFTKSYRSKWDNPVFEDDGRKVALWQWLIDHANAGPEPYRYLGKFGWIELREGEVLISERTLAKRFFLHRNSVRALLHRMTTERMIDVIEDRTHPKNGTILTIRNYVVYQRLEESQGPVRDQSAPATRTIGRTSQGPVRDQDQLSKYNNVGDTRNVGERGGPGGERREASPPSPHDDRRGYGNEAALPGQMILPAIEVADQELEPVATVEASAPELGSPAIVVEVLVDPAPVTAPPPEVGSPPAASNVVAIKVSKPKRERSAKTRWPEGAIVPDDWITEGEELAERLGLHGLNVQELAEAFVDYYRKTGGLIADWRSAWRSFVRMEKKLNKGSYNGNRSFNDRPVTGQNATLELSRLLAERRGRG
jgi:hypothetical protein